MSTVALLPRKSNRLASRAALEVTAAVNSTEDTFATPEEPRIMSPKKTKQPRARKRPSANERPAEIDLPSGLYRV